MKNVVKWVKDFFPYFKALETNSEWCAKVTMLSIVFYVLKGNFNNFQNFYGELLP